jgi:very-short-patch-repair endonuclease
MPRTWRPPSQLWRDLGPLVRENRKLPTPAEKVLWDVLRRHNLNGAKFRRQHPIGRFVVDFYCAKAALVVELDGPIHELQREADAERQAWLEAEGLTVLRFKNDDVLDGLNLVLEAIQKRIG